MNEEKSLEGNEALDKIKAFVKETKTCFFCTDIKTGVPMSVRPMTALEVDEDGNIWFISKKDSDKDEEIAEDPFVHLLFQRDKRNGFLNIYGLCEKSLNEEKKKALWEDSMTEWFDGVDDPTIALMKVSPLSGHYWDSEYGKVVSIIKMAAANLAGKGYPDDAVQGDLNF